MEHPRVRVSRHNFDLSAKEGPAIKETSLRRPGARRPGVAWCKGSYVTLLYARLPRDSRRHQKALVERAVVARGGRMPLDVRGRTGRFPSSVLRGEARLRTLPT